MINLVVDTLVFGLQKMGGVSVVWYEYIKRMLDDGRVNLTLMDIPGEYINFTFKDLDTHTAAHFPEKKCSLQILRNTPPLINHIQEPTIFQSTYLRTSNKKGIKNVVMIHDITHQLYFTGIKRWLNTLQKKRSIANADGIICVSNNTLEDIHRYFPESQKIKSVVIYNSASEDYHVLIEPKIPSRYEEIIGKPFFIYVGDRFDYKNTTFFFDILKRNQNLHCVLIGGRDYSDVERAAMTGLEERFHRFTKVPNEELNILYNSAYCMIYPSLYEGFGIPVLEAMKSGCPVIAFNNSSIPEVLRGSGYLLENNDIEGCLKAIEELSMPGKRKSVIDAQLKAAEYFNWDSSYEQLVHFYNEILM